MPTLDTSTAAHIAPIVSAFKRRGVSHPRWCVCSHVLKPVAAEAAAIAHPMHTPEMISMTRMSLLRTERLILRRWRPADSASFAALNADPAVMEYLPATLSSAESAALIERIEVSFDIHGYGLWAVEVPDEADCIGFIGLSPVDFDVFFAPTVEVGWRLARSFWGRGFATEGARAAIAFGFDQCGLPEVVSFTAQGNLRSRAVMERLGMRRDPAEDFDHPLLAKSDPLRRHVLYRLSQAR